MNKRLLSIFSGMMFVGAVSAADLPTVVIGSEDYDKEMCIHVHYQRCLNLICLTSEELDCTQQCKQKAIDECEEEME